MAVSSFGDGSNGALGLPFSYGADAFEPTRVPGLPPDVVGVAAGHYHSLAVSGDGSVWAWGRNEEGQLGRGVATPRFVILIKPGDPASAFEAGDWQILVSLGGA